MAELDEEIIIIEDSDAAQEIDLHSEEESQDDDSSKKKNILIFLAIAVVVIIIAVILFIVLKPSEVEYTQNDYMNNIEDKLDKPKNEDIELSKLENMIAKANYLYSNGSKKKALTLYENIAHFSEAISAYNLGVAQLKDEQYEVALKTFKKAIQNDEKRCVSAINAAVCSLHLKDEKSFKYYIDLAYAYLSKENESQLYSYYYALINYYRNNYLEALSALKNPTTDEYLKIQNHLSAKINALFENDYDAIENMEKSFSELDDFSIGLLYARVGDVNLAKVHLKEAITNNIEPMKAQLALGFVNLKSGQITEAAKLIENITDMYGDNVYKVYPIKVQLKKSLFDVSKAQSRYRNVNSKSRLTKYHKIFYFSPYKIFNANQTISYIRKGTANIYIDNISEAQDYLSKSSSVSNVNVGIARAIKKALNFRTREANSILKNLITLQPKHSILHYNLALTYAQIGNMKLANKHFLRSYHLDAKNYLSGVYAVMTSQLLNKDYTKLYSILSESINDENPSEKISLYKTLLYITQNNILATVDWLYKDYKQRPLYLAMDVIIALELNKIDEAKRATQKLTLLQSNDILPHLMYIDAHFSDLNEKDYSSRVLNYLKIQKFTYEDLYYGPYITRYLYIQKNLIIGRLFFLKEQLKHVLETTQENTSELTSALALSSLYSGDYEESYSLYNNLIDNLKVRDAYTLFLGAVASVAANHPSNAIALLELSKLKDSDFLESRYALGLLYLEIKNNKGAVIQLSRVNRDNFNSEYFSFDIDMDKLLFEEQHPNQ